MIRRWIIQLVLAVAFITLTEKCRAEIVYDNGNHVQTGALADGSTDPSYHEADDFLLSNDADITEVTWKGYYLSVSPVDDNFEILIYADDGTGRPTSPVTTSAIYTASASVTDRHLTGEMPFGVENVFQYSATIPAFKANAGTRYWLEIFNDIRNDDWLWSTDTQIGNGFFSFGSDTWQPDVPTIRPILHFS